MSDSVNISEAGLSAWQQAAAKLMNSYGGYVFYGESRTSDDVVILIGHEPEASVHVLADGNMENKFQEVTKFSDDPGKKLLDFINYMTCFSPEEYVWGSWDEEN